MRRDLHHSVKFVAGSVPAVRTADFDGASLDLMAEPRPNSVELCIDIGNSGDTLAAGTNFLPIAEESDDDITYTTVAATDLLGAYSIVDAPAEDSTIQAVGYIGNKRYVRTRVDFTGTHTNGTPMGTFFVLGNVSRGPTQ